MPTRVPVSIAELVEVKGGGLSESEVIAVLVATCNPLISLIKLVRENEVRGNALGPGTVFVLENGSVQIKPVHRSGVDDRFLPPEYAGMIDDDFDDIDIEKVLVFSFGMILLYALELDGVLPNSTSPELLSLINLMTVRDPRTRPPVNRLQQMAETRAESGGIDACSLIQCMHTSIMGDGADALSLDIYEDEDIGAESFSSPDGSDKMPQFPEENVPEVPHEKMRHQEERNSFENYINACENDKENENDPFENYITSMENELVTKKEECSGEILEKTEKTLEPPEMELNFEISNLHESGHFVPLGHSTGINHDDLDHKKGDIITNSLMNDTKNGDGEKMDWVCFGTPKNENSEDLSDIFGTPLEPPPNFERDRLSTTHSASSEDKTENTLGNSDVTRLADPFTYDRLNESQDPFDTSHNVDPFQTANNDDIEPETLEKDRFAPFNNEFDKDPETKSMENFTSPKDHGRLESCRSCHSVDCQFCSPNRGPEYKKEEENGSLPNLVETKMMEGKSECAIPESTQHEVYPGNRKVLIGHQKDVSELDPFASFDDLSHLQSRERVITVTVPSETGDEMTERKVSTSSGGEGEEGGEGGDMKENSSDESDKGGGTVSPHIEPTVLVVEADGLREFQEIKKPPKVPSPVPRYQKNSPMPSRRKVEAPPVPPPVPPPRRFSNVSSNSDASDLRGETDEEVTVKAKGEYSITDGLNIHEDDVQVSKESTNSEKPVAAPRASASSLRRAGSVRRSTTSLKGKQPPRNVSVFQPPISEVLVDGCATVPRSTRKEKAMSSRKPLSGPEFLHSNRLPSIRLRAPPATKRRKLLSRIDMSQVQVMLLNGQYISVECRTDAIAGDVFDLVVTHTNLSEHFFFGLSVLQDGEHFFMEPDCKLSKYAPPGWKHSRKNRLTRVVYTIYLRLKYYPSTLEFIKTEHTLHEMYLQLRRDLIDERIHMDRDNAYSMAAVALQAEFGDRKGEKIDYFETEHYLPHHHLMEELGGEARIRSNLSELHSQYAGLSQQDAEIEFLKQCVCQKEYSIHFHRLYKTKPSQNLAPTPLGDPDTGTLLWVGIMPKGVIVFEEKGGERVPVYQHPWHLTQTLQFDRKKFVVVTQNNGDNTNAAKKHIYFTDSYKKSSYFVNFAASQHRFCMKMRNWAATLSSDPAKTSRVMDMNPEFVVNGHNSGPSSSGQPSEESGFLSREASPDEKLQLGELGRSRLTPHQEVIDVNEPSPNKSMKLNATNESISASLAERFESAAFPTPSETPTLTPEDFIQLKATLRKDPQYGLGLTLVDGDIKGIKGVYVKSVTKGGPAETEGKLKIGDKLVTVNGYSLTNKDRHYVVSLVQKSSEIRLEALRLKDLYSGSEESIHKASSSRLQVIDRFTTQSDGTNLSSSLPMYSSQDIESALKDEAREEDRSRTLPASALSVPNDKYRSRSASAGAHEGGMSGASSVASLNTSGEFDVASANNDAEHIDADAIHLTVNDSAVGNANTTQQNSSSYWSQKHRSNVSERLYNGLNSDSDGEGSVDSRNSLRSLRNVKKVDRAERQLRWVKSLPYRLHKNPAGDSTEDISFQRNKDTVLNGDANHIMTSTPAYNRGRSELDWADDISMGDSNLSWDDQLEESDPMSVVLSKNDSGGLGIKIAGGSQGQKRVYIKALVAEPALSCTALRPGDRLITVNNALTEDKSHQEVVTLLKNASSPVTLGLLRRKNNKSEYGYEVRVETLRVTLEKPPSGSLGLSLARPSGGTGIYVRVINEDSPAAIEGTLRVGDRLWKINEDSVEEASPYDVVEKLRAADKFVTLVVKREL